MHVLDASIRERHRTFPARTTYLVLFLCWSAILAEGYDVGVMGTIIPALLVDPHWRLTPLQLGAMSSAALVGTLFGAYFVSLISDLVGRKVPLIACVILFSLSMLAAAWAPTPEIFSLVRAIGGLGLGGVISAAAALTIEYSPPHQRNLNFAFMYSGYPIGVLISALAGITFMHDYGWRAVIAIGALPLLFVPLMMLWLPESLDFLVSKGRTGKANLLAQRLQLTQAPVPLAPSVKMIKIGLREVIGEIFSGKNIKATICFWIAQVTAVMVMYGLGSWLPQIMRKSGYDLGSSLSFLAVYSLAAAIGGVMIGRFADRFGPRKTITIGYLLGAAGIAALSFKNSLLINYVLVAIAGFGSIGVALVQLGYIANYYAAHARSSATGWAVGIGRFGAMGGPVLGGYLAGLGLATTWSFLAFSFIAVLAALAVSLVPSHHDAVASSLPQPI